MRKIDIQLCSAAARGNAPRVQELLDQGADACVSDTNLKTVLYHACSSGSLECVELLETRGADILASVDSNATTCLMAASINGGIELLKYLLVKGLDVQAQNHYQTTALHILAFNGHTEAAYLLVEAGASVDVKDGWGKSPLEKALESGYEKTAESLRKLKL